MDHERARQCFMRGVELFNRGEFFEAHEAMEEAMEQPDAEDDWEFYLGLLRAAVAHHKLSQGEASSAIIHLKAALGLLAPYPDRHQGIKLRELRYALSARLSRLMEHRADPAAEASRDPIRIGFA